MQLRAHYGKGAAHVAALLGRSVASVHVRAHRLFVGNKPHWTAKEDAALENNWGYMPIAEVAKIAGRTHEATYRRARELGLGSGSPVGFEYMRNAAKRVGYDPATLRKILRWAGTRVYEAATRPSDERRFPRHYVEACEVDNAVKRWMETETVATGAARHGIAGHTLKLWLREAKANGADLHQPPARKRQWRVPSATIDAVVAERRRFESVATAAQRLGVSRWTLQKWLRDAGVPRPTTRYWLVEKETVDRVVAERAARLAKCGAGGEVRRVA